MACIATALRLGPSEGMSRSTTGKPALARCAAIREPIVPAPSTAALRIRTGETALRALVSAGCDTEVAIMAVLLLFFAPVPGSGCERTGMQSLPPKARPPAHTIGR